MGHRFRHEGVCVRRRDAALVPSRGPVPHGLVPRGRYVLVNLVFCATMLILPWFAILHVFIHMGAGVPKCPVTTLRTSL